jgi:hypothetical protein
MIDFIGLGPGPSSDILALMANAFTVGRALSKSSIGISATKMESLNIYKIL